MLHAHVQWNEENPQSTYTRNKVKVKDDETKMPVSKTDMDDLDHLLISTTGTLTTGTANVVNDDETKIPVSTVKDTQKVQGIRALVHSYFDGRRILRVPDIVAVWPTHINEPFLWPTNGFFVRPCPSTPRHGWLDSRVIKSREEAMQLAKEASELDENAQVLLMHPLQGKWSAVVTEDTLTLGPGNDGVTSGGRNIVTIPTNTHFSAAVKYAAGIQKEEGCYLEVVDSKSKLQDKATMVQLRAGPKINSKDKDVFFPPNFRLSKTKVYKGYTLPSLREIDLLEWEGMFNQEELKNTDVIVLPGRSLTSHYAIHAILNNKIVVCKEGYTLLPYTDIVHKEIINKRTEEKIPFDWGRIETQFNKQIKSYIPLSWKQYTVSNGVGILHSIVRMDGRSSGFIGAGMAWLIRGMASSIIGEGRYWGTRNYVDEHNHAITIDRVDVHNGVWNNLEKGIEVLQAWKERNFFEQPGWPSTSIGGSRWQEANDLTVDLIEAIYNHNETQAFKKYNQCASVLHNGGMSVISKIGILDNVDTITGCHLANNLTAAFFKLRNWPRPSSKASIPKLVDIKWKIDRRVA